mmetsp:Transcript_51003/g.121458  ORF Transcript_51003/g.121458 Transcript_51003/m.121458 type:complete len:402 (+) Transcript_51003:331-1536(+)
MLEPFDGSPHVRYLILDVGFQDRRRDFVRGVALLEPCQARIRHIQPARLMYHVHDGEAREQAVRGLVGTLPERIVGREVAVVAPQLLQTLAPERVVPCLIRRNLGPVVVELPGEVLVRVPGDDVPHEVDRVALRVAQRVHERDLAPLLQRPGVHQPDPVRARRLALEPCGLLAPSGRRCDLAVLPEEAQPEGHLGFDVRVALVEYAHPQLSDGLALRNRLLHCCHHLLFGAPGALSGRGGGGLPRGNGSNCRGRRHRGGGSVRRTALSFAGERVADNVEGAEHLSLEEVRVARDDHRVQRAPEVEVLEKLDRAGRDALRLLPHSRQPHREGVRGEAVAGVLSLLQHLQDLLQRLVDGHVAGGLVDAAPARHVLLALLFHLDVEEAERVEPRALVEEHLVDK